MIASEYGWKRDYILDTPICTIRQTIANISARQKATRTYDRKIAEWQTRTISQFVAATVPADSGGKQLAVQASKIHLRMEDGKGVADDDRSIEQVIEEGSVQAENRNGSYERLMSGFGG